MMQTTPRTIQKNAEEYVESLIDKVQTKQNEENEENEEKDDSRA